MPDQNGDFTPQEQQAITQRFLSLPQAQRAGFLAELQKVQTGLKQQAQQQGQLQQLFQAQQQQPKRTSPLSSAMDIGKGLAVKKAGKYAAGALAGNSSLPGIGLASGMDGATQAFQGANELGMMSTMDGGTAAADMAGNVTNITDGATNVLGSATPYLGAAGAALGAYGLYNAIGSGQGKGSSAKMGGLSGAGMGAGLAMAAPLVGLGPLGWGAIGLMALGGGGLGAGLGGLLGHKSTKVREQERWQSLLGKGYTGVEGYYNNTKANEDKGLGNAKGKVNSSVANDFVGLDPTSGAWTNNKFAQSRDEADLRPEDTWGSQKVIDLAGNDYFGSWSEAQRRAANQALIDANQFDERQGGMYVKDEATSKDLMYKAAQAVMSGNPAVTQTATNQVTKTPDAGTLRRWRLGHNG